jgi:hypothetical protein
MTSRSSRAPRSTSNPVQVMTPYPVALRKVRPVLGQHSAKSGVVDRDRGQVPLGSPQAKRLPAKEYRSVARHYHVASPRRRPGSPTGRQFSAASFEMVPSRRLPVCRRHNLHSVESEGQEWMSVGAARLCCIAS